MSNTKEGSPKEQKSRESSKPAEDKPKADKVVERKKNSNSPQDEAQKEKKIVKKGVTGTVKWFNVVNRYGFISRNDVAGEDIFVYQTAISSFDPKKAVASLGDGEEVLFDVVEGDNGPEAANVSGPNGDPVQGSKHAPDKTTRFRRGGFRRGYRRGGPRNSSSGDQDAGEHEGSVPHNDEGRPPRRGRGGFRRGGFRRGGFRPPRDGGNDEQGGNGGEERGPPRRGRGRGRGGRGRGRPQQGGPEN